MDDGKEEIELDLDEDTYNNLKLIVEEGILGNTMDEVVEHILRQYLWETRK